MMTKIYKYRLKRKNEEGQSMLEFVLVLPVFALILFMVLDYGWLFINYIEVSNTSRNAARIACVSMKPLILKTAPLSVLSRILLTIWTMMISMTKLRILSGRLKTRFRKMLIM